MKRNILILLLAASTMAASAQTPATPAAKPATATAKPATAGAAKPAASAAKLPYGVPAPGIPAVKTLKKPLFTATLRYQEIKVGTGAVAEPNKLYKVHYTGWRAADGVKFDSSYDRPGQPVKDKDDKPVLGADGKPKLGDPLPMTFAQGMGRAIQGFDQGFEGMKVGGERRLFIPWRLAYGAHAIPDHGPGHPGIPAKSDLIFDIKLVEVADIPAPPVRPNMMPGSHQMPGAPAKPGVPAQLGAPATPAAPAAAPKSVAPATPAVPAAAPVPPTAPKPAAPAPPAPVAPAPATPAAPQSK
jgi:peptidylprolyl isomerase